MTVKQLEARVAELEKEIEALKAHVVAEQHHHYHYYPQQQYVPPSTVPWQSPFWITCGDGNSAVPGPSGQTITWTTALNAAGDN